MTKKPTTEDIEGKEEEAPKQNNHAEGNQIEGMIIDTGSKCSAKQKELNEIISDIDENIQKDRSMPNLIYQFSKIIGLQEQDKVSTVQHMVEAMYSGWNGILKNEKEITQVVGKDQMAKLRSVRYDYFLLLLKTKEVMVGLMAESKFQRKNVAKISEVAIKARDKGRASLNDEELAEYSDRIKILTKWIDESDLKDLVKEWNDLCKILQNQKKTMEKSYGDHEKLQEILINVVIGLDSLVTLGAIIGLVIAAAGAPFIVAYAIAASSAVVLAMLCTGAFVHGFYVKPDKMVQDVQRITNLLNEYIQNSKAMQFKLNEVGCVRKEINGHAKYLSDAKSVTLVIDAFEAIGEYLDKYVSEGEKVVKVINEACQEFIQK